MTSTTTAKRVVLGARVLWERGTRGANVAPPWETTDPKYVAWKRHCMELSYAMLSAAGDASDQDIALAKDVLSSAKR